MIDELPLLEKTILVTRGKDQAKEFTKRIKELGGTSIEFPLISFQPSKNQAEIKAAMANIHTYDYLVFTSKNGVDFFFDVFDSIHGNRANLPKIAVVGSKTEEILQQKGVAADIVPEDFVAEGLVKVLQPFAADGASFLLARGNLSRTILPRELTASGGRVHDLVIYETVENIDEREKLIQLLETTQVDVITFTSPSTVHNFVKLLSHTNYRSWIADTVIACIGPVTRQALVDADLHVSVCPSTYTIEHMLQELITYLKQGE